MIRPILIFLVLLGVRTILTGQTGLSEWQERLDHAQASGRTGSRDSARLMLSRILLDQGDIPQSLRYALEGKQGQREHPESALAGALAQQIARIYLAADLPAVAIPHLRESLFHPLAITDPAARASIQRSLGLAYLQISQADSALVWLDRALNSGQLAPELMDPALQAKTDALEKAGDRTAAIALTRDRLDQARRSGDPRKVAMLTNNLGTLLHRDKQYEPAARQFEEALASGFDRPDDPIRVALLTHLGIARFNTGQYKPCLKALMEAESLAKGGELASIRNLMATVYQKSGDLYNALHYAELAAQAARQSKEPESEGKAFLTTAGIYTELAEYETALGYYQKHLAIRDSLRLEDRLQEERMQEQEISLERSEKEIRLLLAAQELRDLTIQQLGLEKEKLRLESDKMGLEAARKEDELALLKQEQEIQAGRLANQALEAARAQQELMLARQRLEAERKDREITELSQREVMKNMEIAAADAREKENLQQISLLNQEKQIQDLTIQRQQAFRRSALGAGALGLVILGLIGAGYAITRRKNRQLATQNDRIRRQNIEIEANRAAIATEKARSDELLLNILPAATANELKATGKATPRKYDDVTVLFTDFSGFTRQTEHMDPADLLEDLNTYFAAFDRIVEHHGLEKIKTIGDAYMCAGGLSPGREDHHTDAVRAGLEMQDFCRAQASIQSDRGRPAFAMRLGIHSGPVVAGVVGLNKFAYDIWGDTVNTASRLESAGESGRVNISGILFRSLHSRFVCTPRGHLAVKNKGEIEMYFVDRAKEEKDQG